MAQKGEIFFFHTEIYIVMMYCNYVNSWAELVDDINTFPPVAKAYEQIISFAHLS